MQYTQMLRLARKLIIRILYKWSPNVDLYKSFLTGDNMYKTFIYDDNIPKYIRTLTDHIFCHGYSLQALEILKILADYVESDLLDTLYIDAPLQGFSLIGPTGDLNESDEIKFERKLNNQLKECGIQLSFKMKHNN